MGLGTAPQHPHWIGASSRLHIAQATNQALNTVVKQHKVDALLDVSQGMHDPKGETLCLPLDGKMVQESSTAGWALLHQKSDDLADACGHCCSCPGVRGRNPVFPSPLLRPFPLQAKKLSLVSEPIAAQ